MPVTSQRLAPALVAGALTGLSTTVLRRMEREYAELDTLTAGTVGAMYATYSAYFATLAWAAASRIGPLPVPRRPALATGALLTAAGAGVALAGARPFGPSRQLSGIEPGALHTSGIYRYSRNPQYLGLGLAASGVAVAARSTFAGLLATGVWLAYRRWVPVEEHHLTRVFGQSYRNYRTRTRRWLGKA